MYSQGLRIHAPGVWSNERRLPEGGGGVLRGKKDRDDRRKSWKTTLKNTKLWNLRTLKYTSSSKINLKNTNKPEFIKEAHSKDLFYTLTNTIFIFLKDFAWTTPKNTKSPITIPNIYDDYPHHPNIGSIPPPPPGEAVVSWKVKGTIRLVVLQILTLVHKLFLYNNSVFYNSFYLLTSFSIETNIWWTTIFRSEAVRIDRFAERNFLKNNLV